MQFNESQKDYIFEDVSGSGKLSDDSIKGLNKEILEWSKYYSEAFPRISQMIDRIIQRLPRFRATLRDRRRLNAFVKKIQATVENAVTIEGKRRAIFLAESQIKEIRSAIAQCYTAIVAFDDALDRTMKLLELLPEDTVDVVGDSDTKTQSIEVSSRQIPEDKFLREIQAKPAGFISQQDLYTGQYSPQEEKVEIEGEEDYTEKLRFGELLIKEKVITREQLQKALLYQKQMNNRREPLGSIIVRLGYTDDVSIARALAKQSGYPFIADLTNYPIQGAALRLVPERIARMHECIPLEVRGNTLKVAIANPYNLLALEDLKLVTNCTLEIVVAPKGQIMSMIRRNYKPTI